MQPGGLNQTRSFQPSESISVHLVHPPPASPPTQTPAQSVASHSDSSSPTKLWLRTLRVKSRSSVSKEVLRLRAEYEQRRVATNLYPPGSGRRHLELDLHLGDKSYMTYWFDNGTNDGQCVRIFDGPGTRSGDILRLYQNLPTRSDHFEIDGDDIRPLNSCLDKPEDIEDDSEDVSKPVSKLPLVSVDPAKHFLKKGKYRSEIENLIRCQGGSVPGHPLSSNVIQLLGRSGDGQLVFEKLSFCWRILGHFSSLALYKSWILQLIDGLGCLHSVGIVHRDLRVAKLLFSDHGRRLVVCDLEGRWGNRSAPEIRHI
ncbi:Uu.00g074730.m01.CDS01 [Anthostomella pinea]|uniref:Uu.00g074730.m01.CDS01 n=1 Tax=Anthostomella pinea TaxID=933095 RepID=A0AAI8VWR0_9PEZI|nr:Uu.00g074730.m01.CDS01 [Anthostomella pinea]